ncbi:MAG TPA: beta-N-acetylhexosaminidase N-terminal domain-containing protein, partial [Pyrinomonadaceae bacterium]|nr:beta-N-acetylhexosaminidase N-terminal domain-containing protein [Pyrinomonadaceae bacterium]
MKIHRHLFPVLLFACASLVTAQEIRKHNLMPVPAAVEFHAERLAIDGSFKVAIRGHSDSRLQSAIARFVKRLEGRTVLSFAPGLAADDQMTALVVHCEGPGKDIPALGEKESYRLDITSRQAILSAPTVVGALRGLETILQLVDSDQRGYYLPGVKIQDQPRFTWRGLLIDVSRHFETMEVLKRNLDAMAAVKLN